MERILLERRELDLEMRRDPRERDVSRTEGAKAVPQLGRSANLRVMAA